MIADVEGDVAVGGAQLVEELGAELVGGLGVGECAEAALQGDELPVEQALSVSAAAAVGVPVAVGAGEAWGLQRGAVMVIRASDAARA